jgi:ribonuclease Z
MAELRLVFLGTGSGKPTLARNVAAVHLHYDGDGVLFDCGEGTQTQMLRAPVRPSRLAAICLTHFHGDHINGLPGFLGTMGISGIDRPLTIVAPRGIDRYLRTLQELRVLSRLDRITTREAEPGLVFQGDGWQVQACVLRHRVPTFGYLFVEDDRPGRFDLAAATALGVRPGPDFGRLQRGETVAAQDGTPVRPGQVLGPTRPGRRVAYISDTRPCDEAVALAQGADILIHEATYLHRHRSDAVQRGHSTVREAAEVAARAGVRHLILTHISPKHLSHNELLQEARAVFEPVSLAQDFAEYSLPVPE